MKIASQGGNELDRVSNGTGKITEKTYEELLILDFGVKHGERFAGLKIPTFEEILRKFAGKVIMNIHVKIWNIEASDSKLREIVALIRKYEAQGHCYFMTSSDKRASEAMAYVPDIPVCLGWDGNRDKMSMVARTLKLGIKKIQLFKPYFDENTVKKAKENGIICNVFWSDCPKEAQKFLDWGIDTTLSNDYLNVATG